ncbi:nicotinate phosphoribosyltransferase [Methanospirillum lacunae]|uniref:nicotinate phosphoribosyltransferase n=1 Tax=Methanospirillum lacunae TaxID=668570 RepID=A0A2V2MVD3_9EURY|nr:nicotinate phosphoribosyltransferase [Methanospirillum lacunae]PWR70175.1 nicotinate phosphoribosyltransferase [Methanospirillum lacunae]
MSTALLTDLYELTMAQSYLQHGKTGRAVFSISVRSMPEERNFLVSSGLESLVRCLTTFTFSSDDIAYLRSLERFTDDFLSWLSTFRFSGDVIAVPEGRIVFESEPLVRIEGPLPEIQVFETIALNLIHHQTVIASKAARMMTVSRGHGLVDFGLRRAHGPEGGTYAARATYIVGFLGTSNLEAGNLYGIPVSGTMAHSYVLVFSSEEEAFRSYIKTFPDDPVLLIDTYDTMTGVATAAKLALEGLPVSAVRVDSGDIASIIPQVRKYLDDHNLKNIRIIATGGVDEHDIERWLQAGVPIDSFGVGTKLLTSSDVPFLDMTYKLVEYEGVPKSKTSPGKVTIPGRREIYRHYNEEGVMDHDEIVTEGAGIPGEKLLKTIIRNGKQTGVDISLEGSRERFKEDFARLPAGMKGLSKNRYPVIIR